MVISANEAQPQLIDRRAPEAQETLPTLKSGFHSLSLDSGLLKFVSNRFRTDFEPISNRFRTDFEPISNRFRTDFKPTLNFKIYIRLKIGLSLTLARFRFIEICLKPISSRF